MIISSSTEKTTMRMPETPLSGPEGKEGQRAVQHAQPFLSDGDDERREHRAGDRTHAAHDDDHQDVIRARNLKHVRADGADVAGKQAAADSRQKRAEHEGKHLVAQQRHAHRFRRDFILTDGFECAAIAGGNQQGDKDDSRQRDAVTPPDVCRRGDGFETLSAVGQALGIGDDDTDDFRKSERRDGPDSRRGAADRAGR